MVDKRSARRSAKAYKKLWAERESAPEVATPKRREGVTALYTDYGYIVDGVEYATLDEAYEANSE